MDRHAAESSTAFSYSSPVIMLDKWFVSRRVLNAFSYSSPVLMLDKWFVSRRELNSFSYSRTRINA
jgi:hypothetical protein